MNDPKLVLSKMDDILREAQREDLTEADKAGLFAAGRLLVRDFEDVLARVHPSGHSYASEKLGQYKWHLAAMLGYDIDNGQSVQQHRVWALGALGTFTSLINEMDLENY
jgi:hypothetical protein